MQGGRIRQAGNMRNDTGKTERTEKASEEGEGRNNESQQASEVGGGGGFFILSPLP